MLIDKDELRRNEMSWARKYLHALRWQGTSVARLPNGLESSDDVRKKIREHACAARDALKAKPDAKRSVRHEKQRLEAKWQS